VAQKAVLFGNARMPYLRVLQDQGPRGCTANRRRCFHRVFHSGCLLVGGGLHGKIQLRFAESRIRCLTNIYSELETTTLRNRLNDDAFDVLFRTARTYNGWLDRPITDDTLRQLYDLMKWGPTSTNGSPARFLFLRTKEAKERLRPALVPGNVQKTMAAPLTAIVAYDLRFYEKLPKLAPHTPQFRDMFANNPELAEVTAKRNSTLQGGYLIIAARALGLDCGPMSGFDNAKVDEEFFGAGVQREAMCEEYVPGTIRSNFLCNIGFGDPTSLRPRAPRLDFEEACHLL
jgi:3-hydroxypropanoate dehydrogenase